MTHCKYCKRELDVPSDDLSSNCGDDDCWGCISEIEAGSLGLPVAEYRANHDTIFVELGKATVLTQTPGE